MDPNGPTLPIGEVHLGFYVVGLLDVLGQGRELDRLEPLPDGEEGRSAALDVLVKTAGFICRIRENLAAMYARYSESNLDLTILPPEFRGPAARMRRANAIRLESFSDTVVSYASLEDAVGQGAAINAVAGIFGASCGTMLVAMNMGHALRGGIDVGIGTDFVPREIYGPVLRKAYLLESKTAKYPRIAIGKTIEDFLRDMAALPTNTFEGHYVSRIARHCQALIVTDADGVRILDYLGPTALELGGRPLRDLIPGAQAFARQELATAEARADEKLLAKYKYLTAYIDARMK